jgi:glycosyltransferase involved in cell wall biosynthesis
MRIVYLNYEAAVGRRFNGYDFALAHQHTEHQADLFVAYKNADEEFIHKVWPRPIAIFKKISARTEKLLGLQNMLFPPVLLYRSQMRKADIIHANLISGSYLSFWELMMLSRRKPMILQLHEFSPFTGACTHPSSCLQWTSGCKDCRDTLEVFPLRYRSHVNFLWKYKKAFWQRSRLNIVVASNWLLDKVNSSPMFQHCRKHVIPFGLKLDVFRPLDKKEAKAKLGITGNELVIFFRAQVSPYKGLSTIKKALEKLASLCTQPIIIITVEGKNLLEDLAYKYKIREYGVVHDPAFIASLFQAADIFLMPSTNETFGMMAIEALACGVPTIVSLNTSLMEVSKAPLAGMGIPVGDPEALCQAIHTLASDAGLRRKMGETAREIALQLYDVKDYHSKLLDLYNAVIAERRAKTR